MPCARTSGMPRASAVRTASSGVFATCRSAEYARRRTFGWLSRSASAIMLAAITLVPASGISASTARTRTSSKPTPSPARIADSGWSDSRSRSAWNAAPRSSGCCADSAARSAGRDRRRWLRTIAWVAATRTSGGPLASARSSSTRASSSARSVSFATASSFTFTAALPSRSVASCASNTDSSAVGSPVTSRSAPIGEVHTLRFVLAIHSRPAALSILATGPGANTIAVIGPMFGSIVLGRRAPSRNHSLTTPSSPALNRRRGASRPASSTISGPSAMPRTAPWWPKSPLRSVGSTSPTT